MMMLRPRDSVARAAEGYVGKGRAMADGGLVTAAHIVGMLKAQGLAKRGILPGDRVWIYTGWSENWEKAGDGGPYYAMAPGLSVDAAKLLATKRIVAIGIDAPFIGAAGAVVRLGGWALQPWDPSKRLTSLNASKKGGMGSDDLRLSDRAPLASNLRCLQVMRHRVGRAVGGHRFELPPPANQKFTFSETRNERDSIGWKVHVVDTRRRLAG